MYSHLPVASLPMRYLGLAYAQRMTQAAAWKRYGLALVFFVVALGSRFELVNVLPDRGFPFLTFFPAVLLATYLTGLGPGLLAAGLSFFAAWAFFHPAGPVCCTDGCRHGGTDVFLGHPAH